MKKDGRIIRQNPPLDSLYPLKKTETYETREAPVKTKIYKTHMRVGGSITFENTDIDTKKNIKK